MLLRSSHGRSLLTFLKETLSNLRLGSHRPLRTFVIGSQQPPTLWKHRHATLFVIAFYVKLFCFAEYYNTLQDFVNLFLPKFMDRAGGLEKKKAKKEKRGHSAI